MNSKLKSNKINKGTSVKYDYAFIVHPRTKKEILKKFKIFKYVPGWVLTIFEFIMGPVKIADITGLEDKNGNLIRGVVISLPMSTNTMLKYRRYAVIQIRRAIRKARNMGVRIVGLGALTSSLSHGGKKLIDIDNICITTGHAYTGYNVTEYVRDFIFKNNLNYASIIIAVVGAAGSVGSISAQLLAREPFKKILLVDLKRKHKLIKDTFRKMMKNVIITDDMNIIKKAHIIITATNAPGATILSDYVSPGTFIVDDAQPSDVSEEVFDRNDVMVIEAGAVLTPGVNVNFDIGLHGDNINYCCLVEVMVLAYNDICANFVIGRATLDQVDYVARLGHKLGFQLPEYQNFIGVISDKYIENVVNMLRSRINKI